MARRQRRTNQRSKQAKRDTNWVLIGGIVIGVIAIMGLLALALQEQGTTSREPVASNLADFCDNNPENCIEKGNNDAPITIVEVSDYGCSHCRAFNLETADLLDQDYVQTGQVKWFVLPFALSSVTTPAAESAFCAKEQDNFFAYHKQMFEIQTTPAALTTAGFQESASRAGLDLEAFNSCLDNENFGNLVQQNIRAANNAGVGATPTFFINGVKIEGNNPNGIYQEIETQLASVR